MAIATAVTVALALVLAIAVVVLLARTSDGGGADAIRVTDTSCADGWQAPRPGVHVFTVRNAGRTAADVDLVGAVRPRVYGSLEVIAAGTARQLTVRIPPGRYQWRCGLASGASVLSRAATVTGPPVRGVRAAEPVTVDDLTPIALEVRDETAAGLSTLAAATDALRADVDAGRLDTARTSWLTAHLDYEGLGVAYGTVR